jgi:WD40 repeat protein
VKAVEFAERSFKGHRKLVESDADSPDGKRTLSGGGDKTVRLWQLSTEPAGAKEVGGTKEKSGAGLSCLLAAIVLPNETDLTGWRTCGTMS